MHLATVETYMHDAIEVNGSCPVCCRPDQQIRIGWLDCHCSGCGRYWSMDDPRGIVRQRRELLSLTRKQIAQKTGVSPRTVKEYENSGPSQVYWTRTWHLVKQHFQKAGVELLEGGE